MRRLALLLVAMLALTACGSTATSSSDSAPVGDLPPIDGEGIRAILADLDRPAVVNVWASWCLPCRSEAPLLAAAHETHGDQIEFIGIDVQDERPAALSFIEEFGLDFTHYFDADRLVPAELGGFGTPITYFVAAGGDIRAIHSGVLDEQTLALRIDELLRG